MEYTQRESFKQIAIVGKCKFWEFPSVKYPLWSLKYTNNKNY